MVKITGNYRWLDGANFDHVYDKGEHMRLTRELLLPLGIAAPGCDQTLSAGPLKVGHIVATSNAYFESLSAARAALAQAGALLLADVANYTNIKPELHLCEVTIQM